MEKNSNSKGGKGHQERTGNVLSLRTYGQRSEKKKKKKKKKIKKKKKKKSINAEKRHFFQHNEGVLTAPPSLQGEKGKDEN